VARGIGAASKEVFNPIHDETSTDPIITPETPLEGVVALAVY
jgi:hypothetical protein